jgi:hypothetical protein
MFNRPCVLLVSLARGEIGPEASRDPSSHMVIDTITIAEHPTPPTTTTDYQDHCREDQATGTP